MGNIEAFIVICFTIATASGKYYPDWDSLDSRPLPPWYDEAKIGIFLHWGVFSVPSYGGAWLWKFLHDGSAQHVEFMKKNYPPGFTYQDFAPMFTAEMYNPDSWAELFQSSGARYVVLTSKHHEGFTLWPSIYSWNWNALDVGPKRDLLGDLARAIRKRGNMRFGVYHSLYEWFHPLYLQDKSRSFATNQFVRGKTMPELYELVNTYQPDVVWSDGDWEAPDKYWNSTEFLAWLFNDSPVKDQVVVNDRWGAGIPCHHGSFYTCHDRYNPGVLVGHKWENCMTLDRKAWAFRRDARLEDFLSTQELLSLLVQTITCGGNLLVNAGPSPDGRIPPIMEERLRQMGQWLAINGEAVYGSRPWKYQNDSLSSGVWYSKQRSSSTVYAFVLKWPKNNLLTLGDVQSTLQTQVSLLGYTGGLRFIELPKGLQVAFPDKAEVCGQWSWVLALKNVLPRDTSGAMNRLGL